MGLCGTGADNGQHHELHPEHGGLPRTAHVPAHLARQLGTRKAQGLVPRPNTSHRPTDRREVRFHDDLSRLGQLSLVAFPRSR